MADISRCASAQAIQIHGMEQHGEHPCMTKITPPQIKRIYARRRLLRQLQQWKELSAIWISAPAGAGKTTLIANYLAKEKQRHLWFQLDPGDADPATFFYYLNQAVESVITRDSGCMTLRVPTDPTGLSIFARRYFEALFLRIESPAFLVFDNFHELPTDAPLYSLLSESLKEAPPGIQLLFLSRSKPPPWFAPLRARQMAAIIGWEELRLTVEESRGIARLFESGGRLRHSKQLIDTLHRHTRGWAAGLILMLQAIENEDAEIEAAPGCARETIFDYFASELFDKADPEEQDFLLKSALLPSMSQPAIAEFTDHQHADAIFKHLHGRNYFITYKGGKNPVYEYHPLFREFLLARGASVWEQKQLRSYRCQAARVLRRVGEPEQAVELLLLAEAWTEASQAILEQAPKLFSKGRLHTLKVWLEQLPPDMIIRSGWLSYWLGICQGAGWSPAIERTFEHAFSLFSIERNPAGMYLCIADAVSRILKSRGERLICLDPWLRRFEALHPHQPIPSPQTEAKVISAILKAYCFERPGHPLVPRLIDRAHQLWNSRLELSLRWRLGTAICPFLIAQGKLLQWMERIRLFEPDTRHGAITAEARSNMVLTIGYGELLRGHHESCREHVEQGLKLARKCAFVQMEEWLLALGAANTLLRSELSRADRHLNAMRSRLASLPPCAGTVLYQLLMSWRAHFEHSFPEARELAQAALELAKTIGSIFLVALCHFVLAHALFAVGKRSKALAHLESASIRWNGRPHQQLLYHCRFASACFRLQMGEREAAVRLLRQSLRQGIMQGYGLPLWTPPDLLEAALCFALERGVEIPHVRQLIRQAKISPRDPACIPERWPMPVRIYTLGRFALLVDDKPLAHSARTKNRPLELLKVIIAFGSEEVAQEKVMDALWPDASGDTALKSLHTTLHRLRKLLGIDESVILKDGALRLNPRHVWVDVRCLEQTLDRIGQALDSPGVDPDLIIHLTEVAERLYRGPFLDSETSRSWSVAPAERLRNRLIRTVLSLGNFWEGRGDWERAADCYRCGLELDPLAELFYRRQMRALFRQGNHAEALATYRRCRKVLASSLGVMPGQKTVQLYLTILDDAEKSR